MCKWNKWGDTRIDPCMRDVILSLRREGIKTLACCCGHEKYPMTIVIRRKYEENYGFELFSGLQIKRKKRFYKRDKDGYYFIPEVVEMSDKNICSECGFSKDRIMGHTFVKSVVGYAHLEANRCKKCGKIRDYDSEGNIIFRNFKGSDEYFKKVKEKLKGSVNER